MGVLTGDSELLLPVSALKTDFSAVCLEFSLRALDSLHLLVAVVI